MNIPYLRDAKPARPLALAQRGGCEKNCHQLRRQPNVPAGQNLPPGAATRRAASVTCELDAATNLSRPIFWFFVANAVADQDGIFQFGDSSAINLPQKFYRLTSGQ